MTSEIHQIFKQVSVDDIIKNHIPIKVEYKHNNLIIYVSYVNGCLFINLNSIQLPEYRVDKWKRRREASTKIKELDLRCKPMLSVYSLKNKGTWILKDLFIDYGNWFGEVYKKVNKNNDFIDFGTYFNKNIFKLYKDVENVKDEYFFRLENGFIRANRNTNFINLTDMLSNEDRDIRNFKKHSSFIRYLNSYPDHYVSGNNSLDEFGMKVSYGHPNLAILLVEWLYKEPSQFKTELINFIKNLDKEKEDEQEDCVSEEEEEEEVI